MASTAEVARPRPVVSDTVPHKRLQYNPRKPIGCGAFGAVYKAVHEDWGCLVAYKKLGIQFITEERCIVTLKNEAEIHRQLRHPHIVFMLGVVLEDGHYGLVLEYIVYGSLDSFLEHIKDLAGVPFRVLPVLKMKMSYEVCCGMSYLHTLRPTPVIHGDLKMQNLLIGEYFNIKISDFGLAKWKDFSRSHTHAGNIQGTPSHIPPEHWLNEDLVKNEKFDVYSCGILLWEMFTEEKAFKRRTYAIMALVISGQRPSLDKLPSDVPFVIKDHMAACWNQEPQQRPTFTVLVADFKPLVLGSEAEIQRAVKDILTVYHGRSDTAQPQSEHGRKIERVSHKLCANIRRIDQILTILVEKRVISRDESESMRHCLPAVLVCAQRLIDILCCKPVTAYQCFIEALNTTNQSHLAALFNDEGAEMNTDHKEALIDNNTYLKANLRVTSTILLDLLLQCRVLDEQELDEIKAKKTEHERVDQLLHFIMRASSQQYKLFLKALHESDQTFIAEQLLICTEAPREPPSTGFRSAAVLQMDAQHKAVAAIAQPPTDARQLLTDSPQVLPTTEEDRYPCDTDHIDSPRAGLASAIGQLEATVRVQNQVEDLVNNTVCPVNDREFDSTLFLTKSIVANVITDVGIVCGIATVGFQVFVVRDGATNIEVFDANNFTTTPYLLRINDSILIFPRLAGCSLCNCLYVSTRDKIAKISTIYCVELSEGSMNKWTVDGGCQGLSVTKTYNLLVTLIVPTRLQQYKTDGSLIWEINLDDSIITPQCCIELSMGNLVLCHKGSIQNRVCILDAGGQIIKSYGGFPGSGLDEFSRPWQLSVDKHDNIFISDSFNDSVVLLTCALTDLGCIQTPGHQLEQPLAVHVDDINHCLFIGEGTGRVLVLTVEGIDQIESNAAALRPLSCEAHDLLDTGRYQQDFAVGSQLPDKKGEREAAPSFQQKTTEGVETRRDIDLRDNITRSIEMRGEQANHEAHDLLLSSWSVVNDTTGMGSVWGVAVVGTEVFVGLHEESYIAVYNSTTYLHKRHLRISKGKDILRYPKLAACLHYKCLYVRHWISDECTVIYRVELSKNSVTSWKVKGDCYGLSVTHNYNLLATLHTEQRVLEYATHGILIREIILDNSIDDPWHCVQLSDDNFVVCHQGLRQSRVCVVDDRGEILMTFGISTLNSPFHMAVDKYNNLLVAEFNNNRVQVLSPTLTYLGDIQTARIQLNCPFTLHLDEINRLLYVGERSGRVLVLKHRGVHPPKDNEAGHFQGLKCAGVVWG